MSDPIRMVSVPVDELAQEIRRVDGNHSLGAGALAEALLPFLSRFTAAPVREEGGAVDGPEDDELPGDFLARVGMDGALWADGFRKMALKLGYSDMDEGWLIGWFCNAVMAGYDHAQRRFDPALATREEAPAEVGEARERVRSAIADLQGEHEAMTGAFDPENWSIEVKVSDLQHLLRAQPPAREDGGDRPIEASWTDGVTHAYVNLSAALSAERQAWRQKLGLRIASVRYLDVEVPPAREEAQPVGWIGSFYASGMGEMRTVEWADGKYPPPGTLLYTTPPAPDEIKAAYQRGWGDRESDIIERAERIAPQPDALAVLDRLLTHSGARGTFDAMKHGDAVKDAEALLASSPAAPSRRATDDDPLHGEVTDEWADQFCEAVNWSPDGQECKTVEGQLCCVTFRDLAKGYILSAIATNPCASPPAPEAEKLREWFADIKSAADSFRDCEGDEVAHQVIIRCDQALAALQQDALSAAPGEAVE